VLVQIIEPTKHTKNYLHQQFSCTAFSDHKAHLKSFNFVKNQKCNL